MSPAGAVVGLADVVVDPDRRTAQRLAVEELTGSEYQRAQPGIGERIVEALIEAFQRLVEGAEGASSGVGLIVGVLVVVAVVCLALLLAGPLRRRGRTRDSAEVFGTTVRSAAEHRSASEAAAARAQWVPACQERFRATVRTLEERVVLDVRAGRTADEVAREAGVLLPAAGEALAAAAQVFDDVTYGERPGTEAGYRRCVAADELARRERPAAGLLAGTVGT